MCLPLTYYYLMVVGIFLSLSWTNAKEMIPGVDHCDLPIYNKSPNAASPSWYDLVQKYFLGASDHRPILVKDSLYDAPCSVSEYKKHSPMAYLAKMHDTSTSDVGHYNKLVAAINGWNNARKLHKDTSEFEKSTCYRDGEYLECVDGKCRCPQSGIFEKFRYVSGPYADRWTGVVTPNTVTCLSPFGAYCIRNSRSCVGGGRCVTFGINTRPWPWTCLVTGVCRDNA